MGACVRAFCLVSATTVGAGIITYCVTLYPVAFCLMKEIEQQLWRLWHYLLCVL